MKTKPMHNYELITREQAYEEVIPSLDRLEEQLRAGAEIIWHDERWVLVTRDGETICYGDSIRKMLINLIMVVC